MLRMIASRLSFLTPAKRLNSRAMRRLRFVRQTAPLLAGQSSAPLTELSQNRETKVAHKNNAKNHYSPEKFRRECVLEKPVAPLDRTHCLPNHCIEIPRKNRSGFRLQDHARKPPQLWSWRRDSNP